MFTILKAYILFTTGKRQKYQLFKGLNASFLVFKDKRNLSVRRYKIPYFKNNVKILFICS